jgi:hypothetical protein
MMALSAETYIYLVLYKQFLSHFVKPPSDTLLRYREVASSALPGHPEGM